MSYFNEKLNRKGTSCMKWDVADKSFGAEDIIPMWVADMDFKTPPPVIAALEQRVKHGAFGYPVVSPEYYNSIINWQKSRFNWNIQKDWICFTPGVIPALYWAVEALTKPDEKVLIQSPVYYMFTNAIKAKNREIVCNQLTFNGEEYVIDFEDLENKLSDPKVTLMIFCSPHNPVGRVWRKEELLKVGNLCIKHNVNLVSDEIHEDLIFKGNTHIPIASLNEDIGNITVTCTAPSKTFNLAGLSTANAIIQNKDLFDKIKNQAKSCAVSTPTILGMTATQAAYDYGAPWLDELMVYIEENFNYLDSWFKENFPNIKPIKPQGTYLIWIDFSDLNMNDDELKLFLNTKAKVALDQGTWFGLGGKGYARMNIACHRETLIEALDRIKSAINSLNP